LPGLASVAVHYVTAAVAHFVAVEVIPIDTLRFIAPIAASRQVASISVIAIEMVVHVAVEVAVAMKPRTSSDEEAIVDEPFRTVVAGGSTVIGGTVVIPVWAIGSRADVYVDLGGDRMQTCNKCRR
jgi:hypothetical protein